MNIQRNILKFILSLCLVVLAWSLDVFADQKLSVVTTLSTFADIAKTIGGDYIEVKNIASPRFNPHFIEPKPSDVLKVKRSDLFIHAGLDLEAWRGPLIDATARPDIRTGGAAQLDLSTGIKLLEVPDHTISRSEGDIHLFGNPHYWLDPNNGGIIAQEIAEKLLEIDPTRKAEYDEKLKLFTTNLNTKIEEWKKELAPFQGQELIGYHNEWIYLMEFSGLKMTQFLEPKPGIPPTPRQLQFLEGYIRAKKIPGIIQATFYPTDAAESLRKNTGAKVLLICQNVGEVAEASQYIKMIDYNISQILGALRHE